MIVLSKEQTKRFWSRVDKSGEHWTWRFRRERFWASGADHAPARIAWVLSGRELTKRGIAASCDVRGCLRHLCTTNKGMSEPLSHGAPFRGTCSACYREHQELSAISHSKEKHNGAMVLLWSMAFCPPCLTDGNKNVKAVLKRLEAA